MPVDVKELSERFPRLVGHMEPAELGCLAAHLERQVFARGHLLLQQGQPNDTLYLVRRGVLDVSLQQGDTTLQLGLRPSGTWVGELGFIEPGPAAASVAVREECELWTLTHDHMNAVRVEDPGCVNELVQVLNKQLADRLRGSRSGTIRKDADGVARIVHPVGHLKSFWGGHVEGA